MFGYGADVVENEPIDDEHPLSIHENVAITPHISAYTYECLKGMGEKYVSDCERVALGLKPYNLINTENNGR